MLIFIRLRNIRKTQIFYVFREHKKEYWPEMGHTTTNWFEFDVWNASS